MLVKVINTFNEFAGLEPGWNELLGKSPYRDISYSFQWYANWIRSFTAEKQLRVIVCEKDGQLLSVLPLYEDIIRYKNIPVRVLKSMTNPHSSRFDILARDDSGELFAKAVAAAFAAGKQQVMVLDHVPSDSYVMKWLSTVCGDMKWNYVISDHSTNYLVKPAHTFSEYFNTLDGKFRKNVNAAQRKALCRGSLSLQHLTTTDELDDFLSRGFALEASGWKGDQGTAIAGSASTRMFYEGIARDFHKRGEFKAFLLGNDNDDLAFLFCIVGFGIVRALKIGVNDGLRNLAPGMLITKEVLAYLHNAGGIDIWDFCGGEARWKRDWGNDTEKLYRVDICNNSIMGRMFHDLRMMYYKLRNFPYLKLNFTS